MKPKQFLFWLGMIISIFFITLGFKFVCINNYGSDLPYWDQWGEGLSLYMPYSEGKLNLEDLFQPHNEHRIFWSRILSLGLFIVNKQWDNRLQVVVNAFIHTGTGVILFLVLSRCLNNIQKYLVAILITIMFAIPFARENVLWGFQSQFYFLLLFTIVSFWLLTHKKLFSVWWWCGLLLLFLGLFTIGSGVLGPVAIVCAAVLTYLRNSSNWKFHIITPLFCILIILFGYYILPQNNQDFRAKTLFNFLSLLGRSAAWPFIDTAWLGPVMWLPFIIFVFRYLSKGSVTELDNFLLCTGLFVLLQCAAIGYIRGSLNVVATRYMDILSLGVVVNSLLVFTISPPPVYRLKGLILASLWFVLLLFGSVQLGYKTLYKDIPANAFYTKKQEENVYKFVKTGDLAFLDNKLHPLLIPYPEPEFLAWALQNPFIRSILPQSVREPVRLVSATPAVFVINGVPEGVNPDPTVVPPDKTLDKLRPSLSSWPKFLYNTKGIFVGTAIATLPYLNFDITGYFSNEKQFIVLVGENGQVVKIKPHLEFAGNKWDRYIVRSPDSKLNVFAEDLNNSLWFAFREPVEVGLFSFWSEKLSQYGAYLLSMGLVSLFLVTIWDIKISWSKPSMENVDRHNK